MQGLGLGQQMVEEACSNCMLPRSDAWNGVEHSPAVHGNHSAPAGGAGGDGDAGGGRLAAQFVRR